MTTLPLWLTCYIGIGLAIQLLALRRPNPTAPSTWFGCTVAVVMFALLWPMFLWCAVRRAR